MLFDFDTFTRVATQAYKEVDSPYTLQEVLDVFAYFFDAYRDTMREDHPPIRREQIKRIIQIMPYYDKDGMAGGYSEVMPDDYPVLIDAYFRMPFRNCDYRVNHFFSGIVRTLWLQRVPCAAGSGSAMSKWTIG